VYRDWHSEFHLGAWQHQRIVPWSDCLNSRVNCTRLSTVELGRCKLLVASNCFVFACDELVVEIFNVGLKNFVIEAE
jgi:hypothetical protein